MGAAPNPSQFYLEWNSKESAFCYYDKESEERKPMPLPFRFLALKFVSSVTGYDEARGQRIYSNEVFNTGNEPLSVRYANDGGLIAQGLYSQIKSTVNAAEGKFTRSIYAMSQKGVIINVKIRGSQISNFGAIEKFGNRWKDEWIVVDSFETKEYTEADGTVKPYTVPVFKFGGAINILDVDRADTAYGIIRNYFDSRRQAAPTPAAVAAVATAATAEPVAAWAAISDDDLPF